MPRKLKSRLTSVIPDRSRTLRHTDIKILEGIVNGVVRGISNTIFGIM